MVHGSLAAFIQYLRPFVTQLISFPIHLLVASMRGSSPFPSETCDYTRTLRAAV